MLTDRRRIPERGIASDGKHCHCPCHYVQGIIHFTPCCRPKQVDDLTATIQRALDEAAAKERAKVVAWFRSPAWQSRHPEDAALARLIGQMIENGEHHHDPA